MPASLDVEEVGLDDIFQVRPLVESASWETLPVDGTPQDFGYVDPLERAQHPSIGPLFSLVCFVIENLV